MFVFYSLDLNLKEFSKKTKCILLINMKIRKKTATAGCSSFAAIDS